MPSFHMNHEEESFFERRSTRLVLGGIVAVLIVLALFQGTSAMRSPIDSKTYQLVSLSTGEVFFGKMQNTSGEYIVLKQAYTKTDNAAAPAQPAKEGDDNKTPQSNANDVVLTKVSESIAKPQDTMYISRDKIVHWENLQRDSKIVTAIENKD